MEWIARAMLVIFAAACGKIGFDPAGQSDAARIDVAPPIDAVDAPPGALSYTFGNWATASHPTTASDTFVDAAQPTISFASAGLISLDGTTPRHGLIRFDIDAIPQGSTILDATLRVTVTNDGGSSVGLYRVLEDWDEVVSWQDRVSSTAWMTPGAEPPGSSDSTQVATFLSTGLGVKVIVLPAALITTWLVPGQNHGLLMRMAVAGVAELGGTSGSPEDTRPLLTVVFYPP